MPQAPEITSTWLTTQATQPTGGGSGHFDIALQLNSAAIAANGSTTAIDVEGGLFAEFLCWLTARSGTTPTLDAKIEFSLDGGSTWKEGLDLPQFTGTNLALNQRFARAVFIPKPGAGYRYTKARITSTVGGTSPSFTLQAYFRDLGFGDDGAISLYV